MIRVLIIIIILFFFKLQGRSIEPNYISQILPYAIWTLND